MEGSGGASRRGTESGCSAACHRPAEKARSFPAITSGPFLASLPRRPARIASGAMPNQPASRPSTTVFFAFSVPAASRAIAPMGTASASAGTMPARGTRSGATPVALS